MSLSPYVRGGKYLVSKVSVGADLRTAIEKSVKLIGGFERVISSGDTVTIKPNLNTADPFPASSDPEFIKTLGKLILNAGAARLQIMDSSTLYDSTREVATKVGLDQVAEELGAQLTLLDEHEWVKVEIPKGVYLKSVRIGKPLLDMGKLVLAPCLKTHKFASYTGAMKLFVGWVKPSDRLRMHARHLEEKVAEVASRFSPSLIVMDARKVFVTGGPASGEVREPGFVIASGDPVSADVVGVRILQGYSADNRLGRDVWQLSQIRHAVRIGLGARSDDEIGVVSG
ncbi:MAG: hypothetical protein C4K49_08015 [Candidatus Thorarchaeota archaeon]|nr:MAG: hypothetical protein C4K49_08015 [Candidatus Thorarchaeota archaeon]